MRISLPFPPAKTAQRLSGALLLEGKTNAHRDLIFATHSQDMGMNFSPMRCVRTTRYKYIFNLSPENKYTTHMDKARAHDGGCEYWDSWVRAAEGDRRAAAVLQRYHWRPREELFDTLLDPSEVHNLAAGPAHADIRRDLHQRLVAWREQQNDRKTGLDPVPNKKVTNP